MVILPNTLWGSEYPTREPMGEDLILSEFSPSYYRKYVNKLYGGTMPQNSKIFESGAKDDLYGSTSY